jgi:hypothetical protein
VETKTWDLIVAGGGAAGLAAALTAARRNRQVLVLERTNECGKKLAVTGGKKGNFTHAAEPDVMARQYNTEPGVLLKLMRRFPYTRIIRFFEELGIRHVVDAEGCVWPIPKSAPRLRDALVAGIVKAGGRIETKAHVAGIEPDKSSGDARPRWLARTDDNAGATRAALIATGGKSYPATGSSGDGYQLAQQLGHKIEPTYSALASLVTKGEFRELAGITVGRTTVRLQVEENRGHHQFSERKPVASPFCSETAPFLFAGNCITGRAVINLCGFAAKALLAGKKVKVLVDWLPDLSEEGLKSEIAGERVRHGRAQINNFIASKSAKRLANLLCDRAGVSRECRLAELTREELQRLLLVLKQTEIEIVDTEPLARATVTGGGVALDEIDPSTFESRIHPGLFFAGEILDVWGRSGGYNLHFAWASGIAAGEAV